jgi:hypothetical protein
MIQAIANWWKGARHDRFILYFGTIGTDPFAAPCPRARARACARDSRIF